MSYIFSLEWRYAAVLDFDNYTSAVVILHTAHRYLLVAYIKFANQ